MSPGNTSTAPATAHQGNASTISKLEDKLEGMNLTNTEDVDQTTNYARRKLYLQHPFSQGA